MRYTLAQLRKMKFPMKETNTFDFSNELDGFEDIIFSENAIVDETILNIGPDTYEVKFSITIKLVLQCSVTLKSIPCELKTTAEAFYTFDKETYDNGDFIYIESQTLDTRDEVLTEILIEKPMRTIMDGVEYVEDEIFEEQDDKINPAFAGLKDLFK